MSLNPNTINQNSKVVLGMIDQCHSETDIVNYILPYIIVINFKIFLNFLIKKWRRPGVFVTLWALALVCITFIRQWIAFVFMFDRDKEEDQ